MNYEIIKLNPGDYNKCSNIWDMAKQPNTGKWYGELLNGNRIIFIYKIDGEFIGEGALIFDNGDADYTIPRQRIYLSRMVVKKEYRNRGIGKAIIDYLCAYAQKLGYSEMSLGVDIDNHRARHLYEKKGFSTVIFEGEDEHGKYVKLLKTL